MEEKEREDRTRAQEERARAQEERARAVEKENEYKNEVKQLQSTVTALALDLKSLQESVPNWGSLQSSLVTGTTDSYASIAARGVPLSEPEQATTPSGLRVLECRLASPNNRMDHLRDPRQYQ
jgi:hypothetical protein